jgi:hypothetical protein
VRDLLQNVGADVVLAGERDEREPRVVVAPGDDIERSAAADLPTFPRKSTRP